MPSMGPQSAGTKSKPVRRDWFGYIVGGIIGLVITIGATWYQMAASQREASAAEYERARAVRQSVIAIFEEQALNGKRLEPDRLSRLIDQRRRDQSLTLAVPFADVVEQAEFNILSSPYLPIDRKEQIKPIFEAFFADLAARSYQAVPDSVPNATQWNELAKQIQEAKPAAALATMRRLQEIEAESQRDLQKYKGPTFAQSMIEFFRNPINFLAFSGTYAALFASAFWVRRRRRDWLADAFRSRDL